MYEPMLNVLRGFLNIYPSGDSLTLAKRGESDVLELVLKPFTNIRDWKGKFFYIENTTIPSQYPALLSEEVKYDKKRLNDPIPYQV